MMGVVAPPGSGGRMIAVVGHKQVRVTIRPAKVTYPNLASGWKMIHFMSYVLYYD